MHDSVTLRINGEPVTVPKGTTVAAALLQAEVPCRVSVTGAQRTAFCGMGICFECRAVVNESPHSRTCLLACTEGMTVETQS